VDRLSDAILRVVIDGVGVLGWTKGRAQELTGKDQEMRSWRITRGKEGGWGRVAGASFWRCQIPKCTRRQSWGGEGKLSEISESRSIFGRFSEDRIS